MNLIEIPKLDHSQETVHDSFGSTYYSECFVKTAIIFEIMSSQILTGELFSDSNEAPNNMTTISGILERSLSHARTKNEQLLILLNFYQEYDKIRYFLNQDNIKPDDTKKSDSFKNLIISLANKLKSAPIRHFIATIKECNHDFEKFVKILMSEGENEDRKEKYEHKDNKIGYILKDILNDEDGIFTMNDKGGEFKFRMPDSDNPDND